MLEKFWIPIDMFILLYQVLFHLLHIDKPSWHRCVIQLSSTSITEWNTMYTFFIVINKSSLLKIFIYQWIDFKYKHACPWCYFRLQFSFIINVIHKLYMMFCHHTK